MVSTRPLIFKSPSPCINPLVTVPRAPITIGIIVTFMFHSFFNPQAKSRYLSFFSLSFNFSLRSAGQQSLKFSKFSPFFFFFFFFFLLIIIWSDRLGANFSDPFGSQNCREFCAAHFPGRFLGRAYTICSYGQILISRTILNGSPCLPSRVLSYDLSVLICCICL